MSVPINEDLKQALNDPKTIRTLATIGKDGAPHIAFKQSLRLRTDGNLEYDELIETSHSNKNLVYSLWFGKTVSICLLSPDQRSFHIVGRPLKVVIAGREFRSHYVAVLNDQSKADLSGVWILEPISVYEQSFNKRKIEEEEAHPLLRHLDRLVVRA